MPAVDGLAHLKNSQRLRVLNALDEIRDIGMAIAGLALKASIAVREGREDDAAKLAEVISRCSENHRVAQSIARELQ